MKKTVFSYSFGSHEKLKFPSEENIVISISEMNYLFLCVTSHYQQCYHQK